MISDDGPSTDMVERPCLFRKVEIQSFLSLLPRGVKISWPAIVEFNSILPFFDARMIFGGANRSTAYLRYHCINDEQFEFKLDLLIYLI